MTKYITYIYKSCFARRVDRFECAAVSREIVSLDPDIDVVKYYKPR